MRTLCKSLKRKFFVNVIVTNWSWEPLIFDLQPPLDAPEVIILLYLIEFV